MVYVSNFPTYAPVRSAVKNIVNKGSDSHVRALVNILESDDAFRIEMALPGLEKTDISLTIESGLLVVHAKKTFDLPEGYAYKRKELAGYDLERKFELSDLIDHSQIRAEMHHGLLVIVLPKKAPQAFKVEIA